MVMGLPATSGPPAAISGVDVAPGRMKELTGTAAAKCGWEWSAAGGVCGCWIPGIPMAVA